MLRARIAIALAASFASLSGIALAAHGIQTGDIESQGRRLHRLLRLRQRHLARAEPDPGLHGSLEPALGSRARTTRRI